MANLMQTFENLLHQNCSTEFLDIAHNSPWVCVIIFCSNGGATFIISNNSQRQFEHRKFNANL